MEDVNESGSNKKKRRLTKVNTADKEDRNGPKPDKDKALRDNRNECWIKVEDLVCNVMDDNSIRSTSPWKVKKEIVEGANKRLHDPLVMFRKLEDLMGPRIVRNTCVKKAFQTIESFLERSKNPVTNQEYTEGINGMDKTFQDTKEELQSYDNQLMQMNTISDHNKQSIKEAKAFGKVLTKVSDSCFEKMYDDMLNPSNSINGHLVQIEDEPLVFNFPQSLGSTKINIHGENDEICNTGDALWEIANVEELNNPLNDVPDLREGTSNAIINDMTMMTFYDNSEVSSMVRTYNVYKGFVNVVAEIFEKHPHIDKDFRVQHRCFQNFCMNTLADLYHNLESNPMISELDITHYEVMVKDMELTGLELSCLKPMFAKAREMLEDQVEEKRLQEGIKSYEATAKEATLMANKDKQKLAELKKKRRLE